MARAVFRVVTCNLYAPGSEASQKSTAREAWGKSDVLLTQEARSYGGQEVRRLAGPEGHYSSTYIPSRNTIAWRTSKFKLLDKGTRTHYIGGKGEGPSRGTAWVLLEDRATGERCLFFSHHNIHQAFTSHPERQDEWTQINNGLGAFVAEVMAAHPSVPAIIGGDFNRNSAFGIPSINERELSSPPTFGGARYDRFFLVGSQIDNTSAATDFATPSDHDSLQVYVAISNTGAAPKPTAPAQPASPPPALPPAAKRAAATYKREERWRFFATRVGGDSDQEIIHPNLPLSNMEVEDVLTGHNGFKGTITPEFRSLIAEDGGLLLKKYETAIWAEESGNILGGGILVDQGFDGPNWALDCIGYTGYLVDLPYTASTFFVEAEPLDIYRHVWTHVQSFANGNLDLTIDTLKTGLKIGTQLEQVEFDTESGPVSFEAGPVKLAWYQTHDLAQFVEDLATEIGFDWHERHFWEGEELRHHIDLGYPKLGRRRDDLRFAIGENVAVIPSIDESGEDYASEALFLGAGEGSAMIRGTARRNTRGLRRVAVVADPSVRTVTAARKRAEQEMAWRAKYGPSVTDIQVKKHPHADVTSVEVGDEILIEGDAGWVDISGWNRVVARQIRPKGDGTYGLTVQSSDRQA